MVDGCSFHAVSEASVNSRWEAIERMDEECAMCACCLGPSRVGDDFCSRCAGITPEQIQFLMTGAVQEVLL